VLELAFGRRFHPVSTAIAASLFVLAGLTLLLTMHPAVIAAALVLYGAGNGVKTIVKGTLPLALLGSSGCLAPGTSRHADAARPGRGAGATFPVPLYKK
jgi:hypothetical protein